MEEEREKRRKKGERRGKSDGGNYFKKLAYTVVRSYNLWGKPVVWKLRQALILQS
jgi:hypothetical protein